MSIKLDNYNFGNRLVSLALDEVTRDDLLKRNLSVLFADKDKLILLPENTVISSNPAALSKINCYNNFDVLSIWENGTVNRIYNDKSDDNYFFVTGRCNSNCIMCPSPEILRKNVSDSDVSELIELARHIPSDTPHLTVTGGEPFMIGEKIFSFINFLKEHFPLTEFLFLTNGRIFAIEEYVQSFAEAMPSNSIVAIPIHGSCESIHDSITRSDGSFRQTVYGVKQLLKKHIRIEIRLVVSRLNVDDFENISKLIITQLKGIEYVSVIAMEMTGNARLNAAKVWIPYREAFNSISSSLRSMIENGLDVRLYNFPLCTVQKPFWTLCEKSISDNKVKFADSCDDCKYKSACGGLFVGTYSLEKNELRTIL